jgi:hypothetical protein
MVTLKKAEFIVPMKYYNTGTYGGIHKSAVTKWNWKKYEGANV